MSQLFIFSLICLSTMAAMTDYCQEPKDFDKKFAAQLGNQKLIDAFKTSPNKLGNGAFGVVKEIDWTENGKTVPVAVKQIVFTNPYSQGILVEREVQIMDKFKTTEGALQMKGCMVGKETLPRGTAVGNKLLDWELTTTVVYIITEKLYASFEDIPKLGNDSPLRVIKTKTPVERIKVYLRLAEALKAFHDKGFVHSDLKPANMMSTDRDLLGIKLIDFGLANNIGGEYMGGTPLFKPIEGWQSKALRPPFDTYAFALSAAALELPDNHFSTVLYPYFFRNDKSELVLAALREIKTEMSKVAGFGKIADEGDNFTKILADCAAYEPTDRPTDDKIVKRIKNYIAVLEGRQPPVEEPDVEVKKPDTNKNAILVSGKKNPDVGAAQVGTPPETVKRTSSIVLPIAIGGVILLLMGAPIAYLFLRSKSE